MGETLSKIVAIIIAVFLLFIYPIINMFENQDDITRILVLNETVNLVDSTRNLGYITPNMYKEYKSKLNATGNIYEIELEHKHLVIDPVYTDVNDLTTFEDKANSNYYNVYTEEILKTIFPTNTTGDEKYSFSSGDYFIIRVINKNKTMGTKIKEFVLNISLPKNNIVINYGGMIKNENY